MQTITTTVIPQTNTKPTRISAKCNARKAVWSKYALEEAFPGLDKLPFEAYHRAAARLLCLKIMESQALHLPKKSPWNGQFRTGDGAKAGQCIHIFDDPKAVRIPNPCGKWSPFTELLGGWDQPEDRHNIESNIHTLLGSERGQRALELVAQFLSNPTVYFLDKENNDALRQLLEDGLTNYSATVPQLIRDSLP